MAGAYTIFGKAVQPHWLAIGTILTVVGGVAGPKYLSPAAPAAAAPAAPAKSEEPELDVEKAINDFLSSEEKK